MRYGKRIGITHCLAAVLVLIGAVGCGPREEEDVGQNEEGNLAPGEATVVERVARSVAPADRPLVLSGFNGTVRLDGTEAEVARLVFEKRARGESDAAAREVLAGIELIEQGDASRYEYVMRTNQSARSAVNVRGTVPEDTQLRIDFESGAVALAEVDGPIEIEHQSGSVHVTGAAASVFVNTRNGDIEVDMRHVPKTARIEMLTSNGDLALTVPEDASLQITAQTEAGQVTVQDLDFASRRLDPQGAGARFEARLGTGNTDVVMSTENGSITLRGGPAAASAPADTARRDTAADAPPRPPRPDTLETPPDDTSTLPVDTTGVER